MYHNMLRPDFQKIKPISRDRAIQLEAERNKEQSEKHIPRINQLLE